ncbi:putative mitochondrial chaperone BCS1-A [Chaetomidium leptoderma]|uniref:Mitochondrial chaperone BCS1-A n=1 Tax=Chaetomidium leptoderma TaxID=669021 RepID=A0AAN6VIU5_9PEZI|nr:putative mitochondrial chaperone BCS1-A [Chaetomidium leptoderma]
MARLNNTTSPTPLSPTQVSVLDFFVPGSTSILAAIELLAASTVHIQYSSEVYDMVGLWVASQTFAHRARSSLARVGWRQAFDNKDGTEKPLHYSPWKGTFYFIYNKRLFWFRSVEKDLNFHHTVVMNEEVKAELIRDIEGFLHHGAPAWHLSRGIPYRKGYLLYGPPGTGKSSLCLSLAGRFDLDVYILNISAIDSRSLSTLLVELPSRCVLLLEDVDAVGISQSRQGETDISKAKADAARNQPRSQGKLSLSELLNALDGVSSHEGRLLMMTTNHLDHLDRALIRAGRVDKKIELPNADKDVMFRLFCMIFKQSEGDTLDPKRPAQDDETVERYARESATKTPEWEFSPAEIQSFLVEHRGSARVAVEKVQEWIERTRVEKSKMARADSFVAVSPLTT